jgi:hypothetical protein
MNLSLVKIITVLFFISTLPLCAQRTPTTDPSSTKFPEAGEFNNSKFTYKIINCANKTFGYDIFADGKLLIHQTTVPGQPGMEGFSKPESAEKVANLVIVKIKKGEMPPTVTKEEMVKLKAI